MPNPARRVRALLLPAFTVFACAEGQGFDRDRDSESGGSGGTPASGGKSTAAGATGGTKATGGVSSGGAQVTGGKVTTGGTTATATGGKAATGGTKATGGSVSTGGVPGAAGSMLTGGPTCHFTDPPSGDGGAGGAPGTGVGASSGADAGGSGGVGGSSGASSVGGASDAGGATSAGDSAGAAGFAGVGGGSGVGPAQAFCDDFEDGDAGGWVPATCAWTVVADDTFSLEGGPGQCQASAGSSDWVDQTIEARVKVTAFGGSSNSYRVGLTARSDGSSNYYSLGLSGNGAVRLLHGTSTLSGSGTCGDYAAGVVVGTWYTLRLEVTGPANSVSLHSFIDGKPAQSCSVSTSTAVSGTAGVFTYGANTTALFDDVRIWTP